MSILFISMATNSSDRINPNSDEPGIYLHGQFGLRLKDEAGCFIERPACDLNE
jgi:hypothetical protein